MFLSRLTLKRSPDVAALAQVLDPAHEGRRSDAQHRLIWSAFANDAGERRDFLWRDMGRGQFIVLAPRPPGASALFEPPETKPFAPVLADGDRLGFVLRANATHTVKTDRVTPAGKRERAHHDVVMDMLKSLPRRDRAPARLELAQQAGGAWLERQGARAGFRVIDASVTAYQVHELPKRKRGRGRPRFGVLDLEGALEVTEPEIFVNSLSRGFGRAKSFGCGLMLIRRG